MSQKKYSFEDLPGPGDSFLYKGSDNRFRVCRILRRGDEEVLAFAGEPVILCAVSAWEGDSTPDPADPSLREIATCSVTQGGIRKTELQLLWIGTPPPPQFVSLDKIKPSAEEAQMECFAFGHWKVICPTSPRSQTKPMNPRGASVSRISFESLQRDAELREWSNDVTADQADKVRKLLQGTIDDIARNREQGSGNMAIAAVQECVRELNKLDEQLGPFIFTIEREDLCEILAGLLDLAGIDSPEAIVNAERNW